MTPATNSRRPLKNLAWFFLIAGTVAGTLMVPGRWYANLGETATWGVLAYALVLFLLAFNHAGSWGSPSTNRRLIALFLVGLPVAYLLCAIRAGAPTADVWFQGVGLLLWLTLAGLGLSRDWPLWFGCFLHAGWDVLHLDTAFIPQWYAHACIVVDVAMGLFVFLSLRSYSDDANGLTEAAGEG